MTIAIIIIVILSLAVAFLLWVLRVVFKRDSNLYTSVDMLSFAQSQTNLEVTIYDLGEWESHEGRKVRFSDN